MTKPLKPDEVQQRKNEAVPNEVIDAVNALLIRNFNNGKAIIKQDDLVNEIKSRMPLTSSVFKEQWLNIEEIYRNQGWIVTYSKPGYNETGHAFFEFKPYIGQRKIETLHHDT